MVILAISQSYPICQGQFPMPVGYRECEFFNLYFRLESSFFGEINLSTLVSRDITEAVESRLYRRRTLITSVSRVPYGGVCVSPGVCVFWCVGLCLEVCVCSKGKSKSRMRDNDTISALGPTMRRYFKDRN